MDIIKKTGTTDGKSNGLGGGGRFQQMVNSGKSPALAAFIGRKIYGKKKMAKMSAAGKKSPTSTAQYQSTTPPKGIAVGNPNAIRT
jgi:hypothetical protein